MPLRTAGLIQQSRIPLVIRPFSWQCWRIPPRRLESYRCVQCDLIVLGYFELLGGSGLLCESTQKEEGQTLSFHLLKPVDVKVPFLCERVRTMNCLLCMSRQVLWHLWSSLSLLICWLVVCDWNTSLAKFEQHILWALVLRANRSVLKCLRLTWLTSNSWLKMYLLAAKGPASYNLDGQESRVTNQDCGMCSMSFPILVTFSADQRPKLCCLSKLQPLTIHHILLHPFRVQSTGSVVRKVRVTLKIRISQSRDFSSDVLSFCPTTLRLKIQVARSLHGWGLRWLGLVTTMSPKKSNSMLQKCLISASEWLERAAGSIEIKGKVLL